MKLTSHWQKFIVLLTTTQRMKMRTMQHTWWAVVLQSYDIPGAFLQAIQHVAHQFIEILSSCTLEHKLMTMDC